ncbi:MAG: hypothetical protein OXK73_03350 [Rhodospirillaceae bacterium]|nr:hypothetical protein [Rhodospirillaceae bacterium]
MSHAWKKPYAAVFLRRSQRIDLYHTIADLLAAEFALEKALLTAHETTRAQGNTFEARPLAHWQEALHRGLFAREVSRWVPASEAMIFAAYGRVPAEALFAATARVAEMRSRQTAAVWKALAMPVLLTVAVLALLWGAGEHFIPAMDPLLPAHQWPLTGHFFRSTALFVHAWPHAIGGALVVAGIVLRQVLLRWKGRGRALFDKIAPFSLYRTVVGSAFLFVLLEYMKAGLDLNERTFEELKRAASPYTRHRIAAIQAGMASGVSLGKAMTDSGHGFPDPTLSPVVAALDGVPDWDVKLSRFVDRWILRSESLMQARSAAVNVLLTIFVTVLIAGVTQALFEIMNTAGRIAAGY